MRDTYRPVNFTSAMIISLAIWTLIIIAACNNSPDCIDCGGGLIDGYLFKTVSSEDLASVPDLEIESCIRFKYLSLSDNEIDAETITVVNDCCCKEFQFD